MKESNEFSGLRIQRTKIASLVPVAEDTSVSQILGLCRSAMLLCNDMLYAAAEVCVLDRDQAVLTESFSSCRDQAAQVGAYVRYTHVGEVVSRPRARALARRMMCSRRR